jgi:hypothetical protein
MPLAPNLVSFVLDAPVEAVLGWSVLTERLLSVLRSGGLPAEATCVRQGAGGHVPNEHCAWCSLSTGLDQIEIEMPLREEDLCSTHPTLVEACVDGRVIQMLWFGGEDQEGKRTLYDIFRVCEAFAHDSAPPFVSTYLGLGPRSHWHDGALLGVQLLQNALHQLGVATDTTPDEDH